METQTLIELRQLLTEQGFYNSSIECQFECLFEELEEGLDDLASNTLREIKEELNNVFGLAL